MTNMADLLYGMRTYIFPKKIYPRIAKALVIITDVISRNITGVIQEARAGAAPVPEAEAGADHLPND